jgi:hypothetical protein
MTPPSKSDPQAPAPRSAGLLVFAWLFVGLPLIWGVVQTTLKALALFR